MEQMVKAVRGRAWGRLADGRNALLQSLGTSWFWKRHKGAKEKLWALSLLSDHVISAQSFILSIPLLC